MSPWAGARWGTARRQWTGGCRTPLGYHVQPPRTAVSANDHSRGSSRAFSGGRGEGWWQPFLGPLLSPDLTEEQGLNPGSSTCWLDTLVPRHLLEPQFPTGWENHASKCLAQALKGGRCGQRRAGWDGEERAGLAQARGWPGPRGHKFCKPLRSRDFVLRAVRSCKRLVNGGHMSDSLFLHD